MISKQLWRGLAGMAVCILLPPILVLIYGFTCFVSVDYLNSVKFLRNFSTLILISLAICGLLVLFYAPVFAGWLASALWTEAEIPSGKQLDLLLWGAGLLHTLPVLLFALSDLKNIVGYVCFSLLPCLFYCALLSYGNASYKRGAFFLWSRYFFGKTPYKPGEEPPAQTKGDAEN